MKNFGTLPPIVAVLYPCKNAKLKSKLDNILCNTAKVYCNHTNTFCMPAKE